MVMTRRQLEARPEVESHTYDGGVRLQRARGHSYTGRDHPRTVSERANSTVRCHRDGRLEDGENDCNALALETLFQCSSAVGLNE